MGLSLSWSLERPLINLYKSGWSPEQINGEAELPLQLGGRLVEREGESGAAFYTWLCHLAWNEYRNPLRCSFSCLGLLSKEPRWADVSDPVFATFTLLRQGGCSRWGRSLALLLSGHITNNVEGQFLSWHFHEVFFFFSFLQFVHCLKPYILL